MRVRELKEKYFPKKLLIERYRDHVRKEEHESAIRSQKDRAKEDKQTKQILSLLNDWGSRSVQTNGYWFHFIFRGYYFSVVNQEDRIVGYCHKVVYDPDEREMMERLHTLEFDNKGLFDDICHEYKYSGVHIDGNPVKAIKTLLATYDLKR